MKTHGLIVADNGSDMYIGGTFDTRWNNGILNPAFAALTAGDFEVVQLGWKPDPGTAAPSLALGRREPVERAGRPALHRDGGAERARAGRRRLGARSRARTPSVVGVPASVSVAGGADVGDVRDHDLRGDRLDRRRHHRLLRRREQDGRAHREPRAPAAPSAAAPAARRAQALSLVAEPVHGDGGRRVDWHGEALGAGARRAACVVSLASAKRSRATVPAAVTVPAGKTSATFAISTTPVSTRTTVAISATWPA